MEEKKLIKVMYAGVIPELGFILGPIIHPYKVDMETVGRLVSNNRKVFEVNPEKPEQEVLLTTKNYKLNNFTGTKAPEVAAKTEKTEKDFTPVNTVNPAAASTEVEKTTAKTEQKVVDTTAKKDTNTTTEQKSDFVKK